jgi:regulator of sirC expression with transglutaminase-like and TPR domain
MAGSIDIAAPTPLDYFASLVADDASLSLIEAAASLAQDDYPELDVQGVLDELDELAARIKRRIPSDATEVHRIRLLNRYFFAELGFAGNLNHTRDPDNSFVHRVLQTRRGIPVSLAVLYIELAQSLGLDACGVSFPGHFLVKIRLRSARRLGEVIIDPVNGRSMSREDLDEVLQPYKRAQGLTGDFDAPLGLFLQSASARDILARMLGNLKQIHMESADGRRLLQVQHRLVILLPDAAHERRDRGVTLARLGDYRSARTDLEFYLCERPQAEDAPVLRSLLEGWSTGAGRATDD